MWLAIVIEGARGSLAKESTVQLSNAYLAGDIHFFSIRRQIKFVTLLSDGGYAIICD